MPARPEVLTITDPRALRAISHPARQRVLIELYSGETLTASEAAEICGLSPSAMSYHLRALEKAGIVERATSTDGRERPWRAAARSVDVSSAAHVPGSSASHAHLGPWLAELGSGLDRLLGHAAASDVDRGMASRGRLWLTEQEERELTAALGELWRRFEGRTRKDHPSGAYLMDFYALLLPTDPPPEP